MRHVTAYVHALLLPPFSFDCPVAAPAFGFPAMILSAQKTTTGGMVGGIFAIALTAFVVAFLYFARALLIPLALAALLTFLLTPSVTWLERRIGRIPAVFVTMSAVILLVLAIGWTVARQAIDLATKLPDYKANIVEKLHAVRLPADANLDRFADLINELEKEIPVPGGPVRQAGTAEVQGRAGGPKEAIPVTVVTPGASSGSWVQLIAQPLFTMMASAGFVLILTVFMLIQRRDLRGRLIRLIGQGRISETTHALDDASVRVARYLLMQLFINASFGTAVGLGMSLVGVPNAPLWGLFAAVLRFVPYIGAWIALAFPLVISLAAYPGWDVPLMALAVFVTFEVIVMNVAEPLLYRSSTGVSSVALIIAAFFWTWLWGPVGLVLATPLTVCLVVIGRHVPRLEFFAVLLGNDEPLTQAEECYQRLLGGHLNEASDIINTYVKAHSLTGLYDEVLLPTVMRAEKDYARRALDEAQRITVLNGIRDLVQEMGTRPVPPALPEADKAAADLPSTWRTVCVPAKGVRDEIAGSMFAHLLHAQGLSAVNSPIFRDGDELTAFVKKHEADAICISVVRPSTIVHARFLCSWLRSHFPRAKIIVGIWGDVQGIEEAEQSLTARGANEVVGSFADAMKKLGQFATPIAEPMESAEIPVDEETRLAALRSLDVLDAKADPAFDRATRNLAQIFEVPIALVSIIDRNRQVFKSQVGLPADIAAAGSTSREVSICSHVVATNEVLVVEDLTQDRRFANNPLVKERGLRFYAGIPLRAPGGQPVGSVCILDMKPRRFNAQERRLLEVMAKEITEELGKRAVSKPKPELAATS